MNPPVIWNSAPIKVMAKLTAKVSASDNTMHVNNHFKKSLFMAIHLSKLVSIQPLREQLNIMLSVCPFTSI